MHSRLNRHKVQGAFVKKVEKISGQNIFACYQCGKCSAGCPMIDAMDYMPSQAMKLLQMGCEAEIINSKTMWMCASCHTCSTRCPREIDLSAVMEALRLMSLRSDVDMVDLSKIPMEELEQLPQIALVCNFRKMTR